MKIQKKYVSFIGLCPCWMYIPLRDNLVMISCQIFIGLRPVWCWSRSSYFLCKSFFFNKLMTSFLHILNLKLVKMAFEVKKNSKIINFSLHFTVVMINDSVLFVIFNYEILFLRYLMWNYWPHIDFEWLQ